MSKINIAVIGGGAAGMSAAIFGADGGANVTLFERNGKVGRKLYITGKGRCNITNNVSKDMFLRYVVNNPRFLYGALNFLPPDKTIELMQDWGCKLKVERGGRVFPADDKSSDVIDALRSACLERGVTIATDRRITDIINNSDGFLVKWQDGGQVFDRVIIATGGMSYPGTGSTGDGYQWAAKLGHKIVTPVQALCPILTAEDVSGLQGLSLKNVELTARYKGKEIAREFGDMLFTDKGISGPIVLSVSSYINRLNLSQVTLSVDLKPALSRQKLDDRLLRDFSGALNKQFKNSLDGLLPKTLIGYIIELSKIPPFKPIHSVTKEERQALIDALKALPLTVRALGGMESAIVTSGGVDTKEINPSTLESKLVKGLYFCGEVMDVDALTGGYNIQIALSTGALAGAKSSLI